MYHFLEKKQVSQQEINVIYYSYNYNSTTSMSKKIIIKGLSLYTYNKK